MSETIQILETQPEGKWEIQRIRDVIKLLVRSQKYVMSVIPTSSLSIVDGKNTITYDNNSVEVVFWQYEQGEQGDQVSGGGWVSSRDFPVETKNPEWWTEFADRYGRKFTSLPEDINPTDLFEKTFPDIMERRRKRLSQPMAMNIEE